MYTTYSGIKRREVQESLKLAWPVIVLHVLEFLPNLTSTIFVGHLDDRDFLDGAAVGTMVCRVFCQDFSLVWFDRSAIAEQTIGYSFSTSLGFRLASA